MKKILAACALIAAAVSQTALADTTSGKLYGLGSLNYGSMKLQDLPGDVQMDEINDNGFGVGMGWRANQFYGLEVGVHDNTYKTQASRDGAAYDSHARDISLTTIAYLPVTSKIDVFAKFGIAHTVIGTEFGELRAIRPTMGLGAQISITDPLYIRASYDYIPSFAGTDADLSRGSISALYHF